MAIQHSFDVDFLQTMNYTQYYSFSSKYKQMKKDEKRPGQSFLYLYIKASTGVS